MKKISIIGPTASGKTDLAIKVAKKIDAHILSIDSLSIYKEIDIVSAKASLKERDGIKHFGIDVLNPDEYFSVDIFMELYLNVLKVCKKDSKNLIIVGGTSFYLSSLLNGLSILPDITPHIQNEVRQRLKNLQESYDYLNSIDPLYMKNISKNDSYRIEKAMLIHMASAINPSEWFKLNPPKPIIENLDIFNIVVDKEILKKRITTRTHKMLDLGLIDEVCRLEQKYGRSPNSMGAIGIVEVLEFLDAKVSKEVMLENISTHTAQLAKRQQTFNRTQFHNITHAPLDELEELILSTLS